MSSIMKPHINLPDSENLSYELLDFSNYLIIYDMFKDDNNPFVENYYKDEKLLYDEITSYLEYSMGSFKRGACSWLYKLKDTGEYVGNIDLYNISYENYDNARHKCSIGFTTRACFRQQNYTTEAIKNLLNHILTHYERNIVVADTKLENIPTQMLLKKLGFSVVQDYDDVENMYFKLNLKSV